MIYGEAEVAGLFGCKVGTVHQWRKRHILPEPDGFVSIRTPYWTLETIAKFALDTGRHFKEASHANPGGPNTGTRGEEALRLDPAEA